MLGKKTITEVGLLKLLERGEVKFPPLAVTEVQVRPRLGVAGRVNDPDALLTLRWQGRAFRFGVECRRLWTPKAVAGAVDAIRRKLDSGKYHPLLLVPFLGKERLAELEAQAVSGIDLCGNGVVIVPGELLVFRTGFPNDFRRSGAIKNVYRKNSSVAARLFLLVPEFASVQESLEEIRRRGGKITLATVSKVGASLDADAVVERARDEATGARRVRLLQPDKLLDLLAENYVPPEVSRRFTGKCSLAPEEFRQRLATWESSQGGRVVLTGASSVDAYAVMAREPMQSFYCSDLDGVLGSLGDGLRATERFATLTFLETQDDFVYFDRRPGLVASPLQAYLELAAGDKREQETAGQVRRVILEPLIPESGKG